MTTTPPWTPGEQAWVTEQWAVDGRSQVEIGDSLGIQSSAICVQIAAFTYYWIGDHHWSERKTSAAEALRSFKASGGTPEHPISARQRQILNAMPAARLEHTWLLRAEGLTLQQIADRLGGISRGRVKQLLEEFCRRTQKATRRTRWRWVRHERRTESRPQLTHPIAPPENSLVGSGS